MRGCAEEVDVVVLKKCIGGGRCVLEPLMRGVGVCLSAPPRDGDEGVQEKGGVQEVYVLGVCKKYGCCGVCKNGCWGCAIMGVGGCVQEWGLAERGGGVY
ncbi:hypothetical protein GEV33_000047 [Tenebrio molitor]|uniref:Uncharacterized protein n=1 Tax=Tenebrio molitor TaxID=7067 RepID=A0A8J6LHB8_TENMO|nr:hypothetical protein GEV33_000047 [Tenebrio molitor]